MIIKQTVIPLKMSRDRDLEEDGNTGTSGDWVMLYGD
jgi:hypothetical protein